MKHHFLELSATKDDKLISSYHYRKLSSKRVIDIWLCIWFYTRQLYTSSWYMNNECGRYSAHTDFPMSNTCRYVSACLGTHVCICKNVIFAYLSTYVKDRYMVASIQEFGSFIWQNPVCNHSQYDGMRSWSKINEYAFYIIWKSVYHHSNRNTNWQAKTFILILLEEHPKSIRYYQ